MLRYTMYPLIQRVRTLIADTGTTSTFSDDEIQDALDVYRVEMRYTALRPAPTFQPGGAVLFQDFYAGEEAWEDDVVFQQADYGYVTPDVSEPLVGHWHFPTQPVGFSIRATGKVYDVFAAAADLLEAWAAKKALVFDVQSAGDRFQMSQQFDQLAKLAAKYRAQAKTRSSDIITSDFQSEYLGGGVTYPTYDSYGW